MKGGLKKRSSNTTDAVVQPPPHPPDAIAAVAGVQDAVEDGKISEEFERFEAAEEAFEEDEGEEDDSEGVKEYEQSENMRTGEADGMKLADGYFEIEAVRRKRVRKGKLQYLIKWRDWSEAANTWEPVENLVEVSDIIDAFEESLKAGKSRSIRKRKRKTSITPVQNKKKQPQQHQRSPATGTYNVPSHVVRVVDSPISLSMLNNVPCTNEIRETNANGVNSPVTSNKVNENGARTLSFMSEGKKEQSKLDFKLCELKGAKAITMGDSDRLGVVTSLGCQLTEGDNLANGLRKTDGVDPVQSGRCTGAKKRKSGSVKRFKKDPAASCFVDDAVKECASVVPTDVKHPDVLGNNCKNKYEDSKSMCTITQIVKPISYKASISNNAQEVLVAFEALRSDGTKVTVDNKFLKANNPLLLIDFYEKHLLYNPT